MSEPEDKKITSDLEDVSARLKRLNARVNSLSSSKTGEIKTHQYSTEEVKNMSVEQMREKLRTINQYLRRKLEPDAVINVNKKVELKE